MGGGGGLAPNLAPPLHPPLSIRWYNVEVMLICTLLVEILFVSTKKYTFVDNSAVWKLAKMGIFWGFLENRFFQKGPLIWFFGLHILDRYMCQYLNPLQPLGYSHFNPKSWIFQLCLYFYIDLKVKGGVLLDTIKDDTQIETLSHFKFLLKKIRYNQWTYNYQLLPLQYDFLTIISSTTWRSFLLLIHITVSKFIQYTRDTPYTARNRMWKKKTLCPLMIFILSWTKT